jgi:hypothetical protein
MLKAGDPGDAVAVLSCNAAMLLLLPVSALRVQRPVLCMLSSWICSLLYYIVLLLLLLLLPWVLLCALLLRVGAAVICLGG